ncbi:MAG: ParA family protein [Hymenobacter sp.]|nr:MAG: ParA family protein [Hymenobacter sp.]
MKIITIAHQKGGVGKTTLTLNLAACFAQGLNVGVLDTDVQGSLSGIREELENITFVPYDGKMNRLTEQPFDILIIDTPPYLTNQLPDLFAVSDFVLVPSKVGFFDVMAIKATVEFLKQAQRQRPQLKYGVVLNMVKPRTALNKSVQEILNDYGAILLTTTVSDRVSYTRSAITSGVFSSDDVKAKEEITELADEILTALGL